MENKVQIFNGFFDKCSDSEKDQIMFEIENNNFKKSPILKKFDSLTKKPVSEKIDSGLSDMFLLHILPVFDSDTIKTNYNLFSSNRYRMFSTYNLDI